MITIHDSYVKSPSQTLAWLTCRQYWLWSRKLKPSEKALTNMILGRKVSKALEIHLKHGYVDPTTDLNILPDEPMFQDIYTSLSLGSDISDIGQPYAIEQPFKECRPDVVLFDSDNTLIIIDHKVTRYCKQSDALDRIKTLDQQHQLKHYAWRVSQELHYDVLSKDIIVGVNLIILNPKPMRLIHTWKENYDSINKWLHETIPIWLDIHNNRGNIYKNIKACFSKYGPCDFFRACWIVENEEQAMQLYGPAEGRDHPTPSTNKPPSI